MGKISSIASKMRVPFYSLRSKMLIGFGAVSLAAYCVLVGVWMFGVPFLDYGGIYEHEKKQVLAELALVADLKKERLELLLSERKNDAIALAHSWAVWKPFQELVMESDGTAAQADEVDAEFNRQVILERFGQIMDLYHVYQKIQAVDSRNGTVVVSTDSEDVGTEVSQLASFRKALAQPNRVAVIVEKHRADGTTCLVISQALQDRTQKSPAKTATIGVLMMHIDTDKFLRPLLYTGEGLGKTGDVVLVDGDSRILMSLKYPLMDGTTAQVLEYRIAAKPAALAAQGHEGITSERDYRGVLVLAAYRHIKVTPEEGWGLVVKRDRAEVFAPLRDMLFHAGFAAVVVIGLGALLILFIAGRISRPIEGLSRAAAEVEAGNFATRAAASSQDEVGRLAATFNSMVERIQHWHEDLQEQVRARTFQFRETNKALVAEIERRKHVEDSLLRTNRALNTLSDCNQALIRADNEVVLVNEICRVIVEVGRFKTAYVCYANESGTGEIRSIAGAPADAVVPCSEVLRAAQAAIMTGEPVEVIVESPAQPEVRRPGEKSGTWLGLPIKVQGNTYAALVILSLQEGGFQADEKKLLFELSADVAYGISVLRVKQLLIESEMRFRMLFDSAADSIFILDAEGDRLGHIVMANRTAADQHGYSQEELTKLTIADLDTAESAVRAPDLLQRLLRGETVTAQANHRRKDGTVFPVEINARLIELAGRKCVLAIDRDVTERELSQAALRESEERMRIIIDSSPVGICVAQERRYVYANPAFVRMFGYPSASHIIGRSVEELCAPEEREQVRAWFADREAGRNVRKHYEVTALRSDGRAFDTETWTETIQYQGKAASLGFVLDVSEPKSLRSQLIQAQKMEAVGTLAGGIAHDFNNLLTVILGYSDILLAEKASGDPDREDLQKIVHAARSGADLVRMLLMFSRRIEPELKPVNLNRLIDNVRKMLSRIVPKMVEIELLLGDRLEVVNADPSQMQQVLVNLAVNARDAMPDGGRFTIETRNVTLDEDYASAHLGVTPGRYVMLAVSDTGHGMDRETLAHIFEPFFTTKEAGRGTGLGLAMAYGIVKQHRGNITCYSEPGSGTTFKIYLPVIEAVPAFAQHDADTFQPRGGSETILLVDDEEHIRELGAKILRSAGYTVHTAANGREGLEVFRREKDHVALVVLDLIMPEMGGKQCLEELLGMDPQLKVVIASGHMANGRLKEAIERGARGHVHKPYSSKEFLHAIRTVLDET